MLFPFDKIDGIQTKKLYGYHCVADAINALLNGTGLKTDIDESCTLSIVIDPSFEKTETMFKAKNNKLATAVLGIIGSLGSSHGHATEEAREKAKSEIENIEVITILGITGSLKQSMNAKRFSNEIMDSISAEDIGQLPDENIAEALQRVTGIQMTRGADGEGTTVQIRGVSNNNVEINGQTISGTSSDRSVNFQDLPSGLFSTIEILKAPSADKIEGSLGGTINLKTRKPLGIKDNAITSFTLKGKHSQMSGQTDPDISTFLGRNWRDTSIGDIGFTLSAGTKKVSSLTQAYGGGDFETAAGAWFKQTGTSGANIKEPFKTGEHAADQNIDVNGDGVSDVNDIFYVPNAFRMFSNERESKRNSFNAALQWKPTDGINLFIDATFADSEEVTHNSRYNIQFNKGFALPLISGTHEFDFLASQPNGDSYIMSAGRLGGANVKTGAAPSAKTKWRESRQFTFGGDIQINTELNISAEVSSSVGKSWTEQASSTMGYDWDLDDKIKDWGGIVDFGLSSVDLVDFTLNESPSNTGNPAQLVALDPTDINYERLNYDKYSIIADDTQNKSDSVRLDAVYELESDFITQVMVGARYSKQSYENQAWNNTSKSIQSVSVLPGNNSNPESEALAVAMQECISDGSKEVLSGETGNMPRTWSTTTCASDFYTNLFELADIRTADPQTGVGIYEKTAERFDVTEESSAFYVRFDFQTELFGKDVYGNFGSRYIGTETTSSGFAKVNNVAQWVEIKGDYNELLPSLNINMAMSEDIILRFAYAEVMARLSKYGYFQPIYRRFFWLI